jgi:hypothetical protein
MDNGQTVTPEFVRDAILQRRQQLRQSRALDVAATLLNKLVTAREFPDFLTLASYDLLD